MHLFLTEVFPFYYTVAPIFASVLFVVVIPGGSWRQLQMPANNISNAISWLQFLWSLEKLICAFLPVVKLLSSICISMSLLVSGRLSSWLVLLLRTVLFAACVSSLILTCELLIALETCLLCYRNNPLFNRIIACQFFFYCIFIHLCLKSIFAISISHMAFVCDK